MIVEQFTFETAGNTVESSSRFDLAAGSSAAMVWGGTQPSIWAQIGNAASKAVHTTSPTRANQSVTVTSVFSLTGTATAMFSGGFVRFVDANNYILARVSHAGSKQMTVIERVAGTDHTRVTLSAPGIAASAATIRIEVLGSRVRAWYDSGHATGDRPPDGAADLTGDPTAVGRWGIYMEANGTNSMHLVEFDAAMLPRAVMSPPQLIVAAPGSLNFTPVTLAIVTLDTAAQIEWEVLPSDPADFPEAYRAITDLSVTSHVVWVRPGYTYKARARALNTSPLPWSEYVVIGPIGSPGGTGWTSHAWQLNNWPARVSGTATDVTVPAAADTFPAVSPDWVLETSDTSTPVMVSGVTGKDRVQTTQPRPRRGFKFGFEDRLMAEYQLLIGFFESVQAKNKAFNWSHPLTGETFILRFNADDYTEIFADYSNVANSPIVGNSFEVVEVTINVVPTYTFSLLADSSL